MSDNWLDDEWGNLHDEVLDAKWRYKKTEEVKKRISNKVKENFLSKEWKQSWYDANNTRFNDLNWREQNKHNISNFWKDDEWRDAVIAKRKETLSENPDIIKNAIEKRKETLSENPDIIKNAIEKRVNNKQWQESIANARRKQAKDPAWHEATVKGIHKYLKSPEGKETRKKQGENRKNDPVWKRKTLIGQGKLPFYTPWGYYYNANLAASESATKNTHYEIKTRSRNKKKCCAGKLRRLLKDQNEKDFYFITWEEYDNIKGGE